MLTILDICLVQSQLRTAAQRSNTFSRAFCRRVLIDGADSRPSLSRRLSVEETRLCVMLDDFNEGLETSDAILSELMFIGRRLGASTSPSSIFDAVGVALLDALQEALGDAFTGKARDAWSRVFAVASDGQLEAA